MDCSPAQIKLEKSHRFLAHLHVLGDSFQTLLRAITDEQSSRRESFELHLERRRLYSRVRVSFGSACSARAN
jgi:hypothetical protein